MGCNQYKCFVLFVVFTFCSFSRRLSASPFISDGVFDSLHLTGRSLLQAKKSCPVNFEFLNYTIITSRCKGPKYPADICCAAFKDFACPFANELNDLTNDCATAMFSYMSLNGKYPRGLFANECKDGKDGLNCPAPPPSQSADDKSSQMACIPSPVLILTAAFLVILLLLQSL